MNKVCVTVLLWLLASVVGATPITFTHTGSGSGSIDGSTFDNTSFVISAAGDTSNREEGTGFYFITHTSASIDILGVGVFDFVSPTMTFFNGGILALAGFSRAASLPSVNAFDLFNTIVPLSRWDMLTSVGPFSGSGILLQWSPDHQISTSGGILSFDSDHKIPATFQASVNSVPLPATTWLIGSVLLGLGAAKRRKG